MELECDVPSGLLETADVTSLLHHLDSHTPYTVGSDWVEDEEKWAL